MDAYSILKYVIFADDVGRQGVETLAADSPLNEQLLALFGSDSCESVRDVSAFLEQTQRDGEFVSIFYEYGEAGDGGFAAWLKANALPIGGSEEADIVVSLEGGERVRIWYFC